MFSPHATPGSWSQPRENAIATLTSAAVEMSGLGIKCRQEDSEEGDHWHNMEDWAVLGEERSVLSHHE